MNSQQLSVTQVNVDDLVIDMTLDADNVQEKKVSMSSNGMIQPLTLWKQDLRIIDGFHRVAAAKLLKWEHVDAVIRDVSEEAFWDARIQSARQHANISNDRLVEWIIACWKASEWPSKLNFSALRKEDVKKFGEGRSFHRKPTQDITQERKQVAEALWLLRTDQAHDSDKERLSNWFDEKASKWSMTMAGLERIIYGLVAIPQINEEFDAVAKAKGLTFDQRNDLAYDVIHVNYHTGSPARFDSKLGVARVASDYLVNAQHGETIRQFSERKREGERKEDERRRQEAAIEHIRSNIGHVERLINNHYDDLRQAGPSGAAILLDAANRLIDLADKVYPGAKAGRQADEISAENQRLYAELREARLHITQLEQDLRRKQGILGSVKGAFVQHSTDISKSTN